ncbi:MAG: hypothetical protein FWG41_04960 [Methanomassiliicoccaceae archaeon]|nr:hypothetical protein [Methanomassiliicoccaceae archaeon]
MNRTLIAAVAVLMAAFFIVPAAAASADESEGPPGFVSYYDQLDANSKAVFDAVNTADPETISIAVDLPIVLTATSDDPEDAKNYVRGLAEGAINNAFKVLRLSSPMAYWGWVPSSVWTVIDVEVVDNTATVSSLSLEISFSKYPVDPETEEFQGIKKMLDDLDAAIDKFHTDSGSVRGIVMDINNYLVNLVTYDPNYGNEKESRYAHDAYGALVDPNHYAVCDGYSKAFLLLCEKMGIECVIVQGTAVSNMENHAWNYVKMDNGKWYAIDVTWNDGSDNAYFLLGSDTFFYTHQQGVFLGSGILPYTFNSPVLSNNKYDPEPKDYSMYAWLLGAAIVALMSFALYRHAKRSG